MPTDNVSPIPLAHLTPCHARHMSNKLRTIVSRLEDWSAELATFRLDAKDRADADEALGEIASYAKDVLDITDAIGDRERADAAREQSKLENQRIREARQLERDTARATRQQRREEIRARLLGTRPSGEVAALPPAPAPAPEPRQLPPEPTPAPAPAVAKANGGKQASKGAKPGGQPQPKRKAG